MFKMVLRINTRCPRHPRYNPIKQGLGFRSGCSECARVWEVYQKTMALRRLAGEANHKENESNMPMTDKGWKFGPTECGNPACKRDLRQINPCYGLQDNENVKFCSRTCRATVTGERVDVVENRPTAPASDNAPFAPAGKKARKADAAQPVATEAPAPAGKKAKAGVLPSAPRRERESVDVTAPPKSPLKTPGAPRGNSPWANLDGKLHITGKTPPNFQGARKQVWELIKEGMTVRALYEACDKAGIEGKANLAKIIGVYGCAEVK